MNADGYFGWLTESTQTSWWHDSADPFELDRGLDLGATGVTSNPVLVNSTLASRPDYWLPKLARFAGSGKARAHVDPEDSTQLVLSEAAAKLSQVHEDTKGIEGYVCAQVDPSISGDREAMLSMATRFASWARNIAVKLPVTAAGLDVLEECVATGITVTATVSFTVSQVVAVAEKYRKGIATAKKNGNSPGMCFAVIMIGRIDDYLRDCARDGKLDIEESEIIQAGLAIAKRSYGIYKANQYEPRLCVAALRGAYHMTELAGANLIMSIHPKYQQLLKNLKPPYEQSIDRAIERHVLRRLSSLPEFVRSYEPEAMSPRDFISFGCTQRTLSQFAEAGWKLLQNPIWADKL